MMMKKYFQKEIKVMDAKTSPSELIIESITNFIWGFSGNSIVVFMAKGIDVAVLINFIVYYAIISYILNRSSYRTKFGRFLFLPLTTAFGAFAGYKFAQFLSSVI